MAQYHCGAGSMHPHGILLKCSSSIPGWRLCGQRRSARGQLGATRLDPHPHHTSPFLLTPTLAPLEGRGMGLRFVFLLFPTLALAQDRYQTDLQDQYQNDPYQAGGYQAGPYQEGPYQEPYKVPTHYQTKKKQYQLESYQEPYVEEEHTVPKPFAYQYGGVDSQGLESSKVENQGEDGVVRGEYRVQLPDGRTQVVYRYRHVIKKKEYC